MLFSVKILGAMGLAASLAAGGVAARTETGEHPPAPAPAAAAPAPAPAPAPATESNTTRPVEVGEEANIEAGEAGDVKIVRTKTGIELDDVNLADGWKHDIEEEAADQVKLLFSANGRVIHLKLNLEGLLIHIKIIDTGRPAEPVRADPVEDEAPAEDDAPAEDEAPAEEDEAPAEEETTTTTMEAEPETSTHAADDAGAVKLTSDGRRLSLSNVHLSVGWDFEVVGRTVESVKVLFHRNGERVLFMAQIKFGDVQVDVERPDTAEPPAEEPQAPAEETETQAPADDVEADDGSDDSDDAPDGTEDAEVDDGPPANGHKKHH